MNLAKKKERVLRVKKLNTILQKLYPDPQIALHYSTNWELLVAVVLSAQCTDVRVNMVTQVLFKKYLTIESYRDASQSEMEKMVHACGFFRNKARNIRTAAKMVSDEFNGVVPHTMHELIKIPGVGRKTANVILSNAFNIHEGIAVDTHVRRFAIRFDLSDFTDPEHIEKDLIEIMPKSEWWGFNHRLVYYGREYCRARKHSCTEHPLTKIYPQSSVIWPKAH